MTAPRERFLGVDHFQRQPAGEPASWRLFESSGRLLERELMGLGDPLRVLANLLIDPDHDRTHADAINPCISILWKARLSERNVEHVARTFKEVTVGGLLGQGTAQCSRCGTIH